MNIRYLQHHEIDKQLWDDCILSTHNPMVYGMSWYLDLVCETWDAVVAGNYSAVFPLPYRRKAGIRYLFQPPYCQQLGLFSCIPITGDLTDIFIDAIPAKFKFAEIFLNHKAFPTRYETRAHNTYLLDLAPKAEILRAHYSENHRRNIRKANENKLFTAPHPDIRQITTMFEQNRGSTLRHQPDQGYQRLHRLYHEAEHRGLARAWGVYNQLNSLIAGGVFLFDAHRIIFLFSGLTPEGKETGAMPFLIDQIIEEFAGSHLTLDFEGSMDPGLARFYASFGAIAEAYWFLRLNRLQFPLKQIIKLKVKS